MNPEDSDPSTTTKADATAARVTQADVTRVVRLKATTKVAR